MLDSLQDVEIGGVFGEVIAYIKGILDTIMKFFNEKFNLGGEE